nr:hypothetical protein BAR15_170002 [Bartonella sp. AR 15-3]
MDYSISVMNGKYGGIVVFVSYFIAIGFLFPPWLKTKWFILYKV